MHLRIWYGPGQKQGPKEGGSMRTENHRIDVHYHIIPKPYVEALGREGITGSAWVKFPRWTPESVTSLDNLSIVDIGIRSCIPI